MWVDLRAEQVVATWPVDYGSPLFLPLSNYLAWINVVWIGVAQCKIHIIIVSTQTLPITEWEFIPIDKRITTSFIQIGDRQLIFCYHQTNISSLLKSCKFSLPYQLYFRSNRRWHTYSGGYLILRIKIVISDCWLQLLIKMICRCITNIFQFVN